MQVGDPFTEKLLIEACLELMATDAIVAIQDMGAAGLTSSSVEMAGKGGVGIELDLDQVPQRETGMTAYEMMLSESQERMLMVLRPEREAGGARHLREMGAGFRRHRPIYRHRPDRRASTRAGWRRTSRWRRWPSRRRSITARRPRPPKQAILNPAQIENRLGMREALLRLIACPDLCSRAWVWDQYDSTVGGQTVKRPGRADAAVVKIEGSTGRWPLTTDCTPRYCAADPEAGGAQAVAEAWRNLTAVGARPLAITDNMNFGNPEKPEIMGQFAAAIRGMADGLRGARLPGRVRQCQPVQRDRGPRRSCRRPAIGGLGVLEDAAQAVGLALRALARSGADRRRRAGWLGQSLWLREIAGREDGAPPPVDLAAERQAGDFVRAADPGGRGARLP